MELYISVIDTFVGNVRPHSYITEKITNNIRPEIEQLFVGALMFPGKILVATTKKVDLNSEQQKQREIPDLVIGDDIRIYTQVAFDNRHRDNSGTPYMVPPLALSTFCDRAGLTAAKGSRCQFVGRPGHNKFSINNLFQIDGNFIVRDSEKLTEKITKGIGSRKSYGYGLILINGEIDDFIRGAA